VNPDQSAAQAQLLTAKLPAKDLAALKKMFARQGFVKEWESQEERAKEVGKRLTSKEAATPSAAWKLLTSTDPEAVLWLGMTSKNAAVQQKFKDFFTLWPESRARIPYTIMQEMRIVPELPGYQDLVKSIFFELIDGKLTTEEEIRQFLEPHSPPAPPPPVTIRRTRAKKGARSVEAREIDDDDTPAPRGHGDDESGDEIDEESESGDERVELIARSAPPVRPEPEVVPVKAAPVAIAPAALKPEKSAKPAGKPAPEVKAPAPVKVAPPAAEPKAKVAPVPAAKPAKAVPAKPAPAAKTKLPVKAAVKAAPAKTVAKKAVASKSAKTVSGKTAGAKSTRPAAKAKPAVKKTVAKKAASKPASNNKPRKVVTKGRPAKAIVKSKPAVGKAKPAIKKKVVAKPVKKALPAKRKR
jgi:tRNA nucleotidyltransferase (CCA-adding enzyme)